MKQKKLAQLTFAFLFLATLLYYVGLGEVVSALKQIRLIYIGYLVLLSVMLIAISCWKWRLFIQASGHTVPFLRLMRYYTTSYFFNLFAPSFIGGDVARGIQLGRDVSDYKAGFATTFVERFTGFLAMTLVGAIFVALGAHVTAGIEAAIVAVFLVTLVATFILFSEKLMRLCIQLFVSTLRYLPLGSFIPKVDSFLSKLSGAVSFARNNFWLLVNSLLLSFAFHFLAVVNTYVCALAVGWNEANFGTLCIVVPLVLLVSALPVTPSSLGIQEGAFLYFLTQIGATEGQALGVALVLRAKTIVTALVGGLIWVLYRDKNGDPNETRQRPFDDAVGC